MHLSHPGAPDVIPGWPYRQIAALADVQRANVTAAQLRGLGISARAIGRALERGRLWPVHRGVYSLVPPRARPPLAAEHAAVLACGAHAVLSHHSAAGLHGFRVGVRSPVQLTVVGDRRRPGLTIHSTRHRFAGERVLVAGLPVTSVARTVVDLAPALGERLLEHLIDEALKQTSRARLTEALQRHAGRPGTPRLRALLDPTRPSSDTWSIAEEKLLQALRRTDLPQPEVNVPVGNHIPDLLWREQRVIVEFDSYAHHSGPAVHHRDAARHNELTAMGYQVIHITWRDLTERLEQVLVWIATALARGAR